MASDQGVSHSGRHLILETKGYDPLAEIKEQAAGRWIAAVNATANTGNGISPWSAGSVMLWEP